eukprot:jgi/Bigna1/134400/aug1.25_g9108
MDRIFSAEQIQVPPVDALPSVMKAWTKEVIRCKPNDIVKFSKEYFTALSEGTIENFLKKERCPLSEKKE